MPHHIDIEHAAEEFVAGLLDDPDGRDVEVERDHLLAFVYGWQQEQIQDAIRTEAERAAVLAAEEGPEAGYTFRITHSMRDVYNEDDDELGVDAATFGDVHTVEVRAWSLAEALRKAADLPLSVQMGLRE